MEEGAFLSLMVLSVGLRQNSECPSENSGVNKTNNSRYGGGTLSPAPLIIVSDRLSEEDPHPPRVFPCSVSGYDYNGKDR